MRVVVDTNILISALLAPASLPDQLLTLFEDNRWDIIVSDQLFSEFRRVSRYPKIKARIKGPRAGRLINDLREIGIHVKPLLKVDRSRDPLDNFLLAMAEAGNADFLITGDKADLLALETHGSCKIVTIRQFLEHEQGSKADEDAAWAELVTMMEQRAQEGMNGRISDRNFDEIVESAIARAKHIG